LNPETILDFLNQNPVFSLATTEGTQPRVRSMLLYRAAASGLVFHTGSRKDLHRQLQANPLVELCFYNADQDLQFRISGKATLEADLELKKEIVARHDFLKPLVESQGYESLAVYRVKRCLATPWTMASIGAPKEYIPITD
jgi:uncharacterized pyridoxamine 5'-phosphate oxidase family protein